MNGQDRFRKHVIAALDLEELDDALALVDQLGSSVDKYKIGSRMFTRYGPRVLDELAERGRKVFLDLKYHDIPSVVENACAEAAKHEAVFLLTVHASGGTQMIARAVEGAKTRRDERPRVVAVTALTSLSPSETRLLGIDIGLEEWAEKLGRLAIDAGADGIVCSAREVERMRGALGDVVYVTPGIRPASWEQPDDQTRVMTPAEALDSGSSYLVIGRPIYRADDPVEAVAKLAGELL